MAIRMGDYDSLRYLLTIPSPKVNETNCAQYEGTALMFACYRGDVEAVTMLLEHPDIDVDFDDHESGVDLVSFRAGA